MSKQTKKAISYQAFSSAAQADGDSERRQGSAFLAFCKAHQLEPIGEYIDRGVSRFHGLHKAGAFGEFLAAIESGAIKRGTVLVIEAWDRFSRERPDIALATLVKILESGIVVGVASLDMMLTVADLDKPQMQWVYGDMMRARGESKRKSEIGKENRQRIRETGKTIKGKPRAIKACPFWLSVNEAGEYVLNEYEPLVKEMFRLSALGNGCQEISTMLGTPTRKIKRKGKMVEAQIDVLGVLRNEACIGRFYPALRINKSKKEYTGDCKEGYYPSVVSDSLFNDVQAGLDSRKTCRGRKGPTETNLFTELFIGADGLPMHIKCECESKKWRTKGRKLLRRKTKGQFRTWDYAEIENALIRFLRELRLGSPVLAGIVCATRPTYVSIGGRRNTSSGWFTLVSCPRQRRALETLKRFILVLAGWQAGKSEIGPPWLLNEMTLKGPGDYLVASPTYPLMLMKVLPIFCRLFERLMQLGKFIGGKNVFLFSNEGCKRLWGHVPEDQPRVIFGHAGNPESLESATAKAAWLDECGAKGFKTESYETVLGRLSIHQGRVLLTSRPYDLGWMKKPLWDPWEAAKRNHPTIEIINFRSIDNPAFPRKEWNRAKREMPGWKFLMKYEGKFSRPAGLIYSNFDDKIHKMPRFNIPPEWPRFLGLDFGGVNTAGVFFAEERVGMTSTGRLIAYREYKAGERSAAMHCHHLMQGEPRIPTCAGGSKSEDQWRREFAAGGTVNGARVAGLPIHGPTITDVEVGIQKVFGAFNLNKLVIFDDLHGLLDEIGSYSRELDDMGEPTEKIDGKENYHHLDAMRYALQYKDREGDTGIRRKNYFTSCVAKAFEDIGLRLFDLPKAPTPHLPVDAARVAQQLLSRRKSDGACGEDRLRSEVWQRAYSAASTQGIEEQAARDFADQTERRVNQAAAPPDGQSGEIPF